MMEQKDEYLQLSGLQHFSFCRRQWALIHIENQWSENLRTIEGNLFHNRAHDEQRRERRGDTLILRGLPIVSHTLRLSGQCDVLEFHASPKGVHLRGEEGLWIPFPVEYKRGAPKENFADQLQLCAQAICLEEMLCCSISEGALFYGETRRRTAVLFTEELREKVRLTTAEMHQMFRRSYTPKVRPTKSCNACSLKELCLPVLMRKKNVSEYLKTAMEKKQ
ncbi:MAG: CRISPR-associated protein Cas4 [Clostridiales bacterium]|nr:MAG: CRISPR-associated protein Cas4 [Clostridiales bacterium]